MKKPIMHFDDLYRCYKRPKNSIFDFKHWFPLYPSENLARIVAALMTDGHIDWNDYDGQPRPKKLILYSNHVSECHWFLNLIKDVFEVGGKTVRYKASTGFSKNFSFKAIVYCAQLARVLIWIGTPCGDKTRKQYCIPDWIMNGSRPIKKAFLQTLFTFDGSIAFKTRRELDVCINFVMNKHVDYLQNAQLFLTQIKSLLNDFDISAGKIHIRPAAKEDKYTLMLAFANQKSLVNFYKHIGFSNPKKQKRLANIVHKIYLDGRVIEDFPPDILVDLKNAYITDKETAKRLNELLSTNYTTRQLEHMRRGETRIPIRLLHGAIILLKKKDYLMQVPEHYRLLMQLFD